MGAALLQCQPRVGVRLGYPCACPAQTDRQTDSQAARPPIRANCNLSLPGAALQSEGGLPSRPLAHGKKVRNNASKLKTFLSFSTEQWLLTGMELEQKWNVNPRGLGAWRGVRVEGYWAEEG